MSFNFSEPVRGVKRHTSGLEASMCAFSVRFRSDGVALWEVLFLVCFEDRKWRTHASRIKQSLDIKL